MRNIVNIVGRAETTIPTSVIDGGQVDLWLDENGFLVSGARNTEFTLLASAARTAQTDSSAQSNLYHKGMIIFVDVTVDAAAGSITPNILMTPSIGTAKTIWTAAAPIAAVGQFAYVFYPGCADAGSYTEAVENVIPADWLFRMTVADADSLTYSVTGCYIV